MYYAYLVFLDLFIVICFMYSYNSAMNFKDHNESILVLGRKYAQPIYEYVEVIEHSIGFWLIQTKRFCFRHFNAIHAFVIK